MTFGTAAAIILIIAGIGFSALLRRGQNNAPLQNPATEAPAGFEPSTEEPIITPTPLVSAIQILGPTILDSSEAGQLIDNNKAQSIVDIAREQYTEDELNRLFDNDEIIPVILDDPGPIWVSRAWCATTQEILEDNLPYIKITFKFDNQVIVNTKLFEEYYTAENGHECFAKSVVIDNWQAGEYSIYSDLTITNTINDGESDYELHTNQTDWIVKVQ